MRLRALCFKCLRKDYEHPWHDNGTWNTRDGHHWENGGQHNGNLEHGSASMLMRRKDMQ